MNLSIFSKSLYPKDRKNEKYSLFPEKLFNRFFFCLTLALCLLIISPCYAVPDGIPVLSKVITPLAAYGPFAFTAGGVYYSAINGRMVVNGDYRRVVPGIISILATTLGLVGLFGDDALTVLVS